MSDSRHLQADCQEPGSAVEPYPWQSSMGYLFYRTVRLVLWGIIIIIIIIKDIYIAQVRKGHICAMSAEMAVWLRNCLCVYIAIYITNCQDS